MRRLHRKKQVKHRVEERNRTASEVAQNTPAELEQTPAPVFDVSEGSESDQQAG